MSIIAALFALFYSWMICQNASFGPIDDHLFLDGFKWDRFIFADRFYPLDGIEQFSLSHAFGLNPFLFYLINSIEFLVLFYLLFRLCERVLARFSESVRGLIPILVMLTPGLATAYLRLLVPERLLVLCLTAIVLLDLDEKKSLGKKILYACLSLVALFLKEPVFLLLGGLSFFRFLEKKDRRFHFLMMSACAGFLALYLYVTKVLHPSGMVYGKTSVQGLTLFGKNFLNYFLNDPWVVAFALPTWLVILLRQKKFDPYLTLIVGYFFVFLYLGIFQEYYLVPLLPFIIVGFGKYWGSVPRFGKAILGILTINALIGGLSQISIYKNEPRGFFSALTFLSSQETRSDKKVCFLGLNEEFSSEVLHASNLFYRYLHPSGTPPSFISVSIPNQVDCNYLIDSPYNYLALEASPEWEAIHAFEPRFSAPNWSIKSLLKLWIKENNASSLINRRVIRNHRFVVYRRS